MSDLAALFAQDPLTYTKEGKELETIIAEFRANRGRFLLGAKSAGSTKPKSEKAKAIEALSDKIAGSLTLNLDNIKL